MSESAQRQAALLTRDDPDPVEIINPGGSSPFVLTCEHAGRAIPSRLGDLGIPAAEMERHIAYDIGAEGLSRCLSALIDAPLALQRYSRLVVDCNRPFEAEDCFPEISDGTVIPANRGLTPSERKQRFDEIHRPLHDAIAALLDDRQRRGTPAILISVHSFTPRLFDKDRPWHLGLLANRDRSFAEKFMASFAAANPGIVAAHNEPYYVDDISDYTIPVHGERRAIPHVLLEIRNDEISDAEGQAKWASLIAETLLSTTGSLKQD